MPLVRTKCDNVFFFEFLLFSAETRTDRIEKSEEYETPRGRAVLRILLTLSLRSIDPVFAISDVRNMPTKIRLIKRGVCSRVFLCVFVLVMCNFRPF